MAVKAKVEVRAGGKQAAAPPTGKAEQLDLPLRVTLVRPPGGVQFCVQGRTAADLGPPLLSAGGDLSFDFAVRVASGDETPPRFLGPFTHGPPGERFAYICVGTLAGQPDSCWTRRIKVPLHQISRKLIEQSRRKPSGRLEGRIQGTGKDGGPVCASVQLLEGGWRWTE